MSTYTHATLLDLKTALATRLGDPGLVHWTSAELGIYITEALRTWGLMTNYWRDSGQVTTVAGTAFYDIRSLQNNASVNLLNYTVIDTDIITAVQYHLLEPPTGTSWTGSEQFTYADVVGAVQKRRDALLVETGSVITRFTQPQNPGDATFDVPDTTLLIRRVAWTGADGVTWPLFPDDINSQRSYSSTFMLTPDIPLIYSSESMQPLRYTISPPTPQPGVLDILAVQSGTALTGQGVLIGIPDDMAWVVKWGALADLLGREGPGMDLPRAYFCERRWKLGLEMSRVRPAIINAFINGVATSPDSISQMDSYSLNWQSTPGMPEFVLSIRNMIALAPNPNAVISVLLDVTRKAIVPASAVDFIQVGREYIDVILDYAEHLAAFKCGGYEFRHTYRGAENFFNAALAYIARQGAVTPSLTDLLRQSSADDSDRPLQRDVKDIYNIQKMIQNE